jgi:hypothetical protein
MIRISRAYRREDTCAFFVMIMLINGTILPGYLMNANTEKKDDG